MLSSKFNIALTFIICIIFFFYIKSKDSKNPQPPENTGSLNTETIDLPDDHPLKHPKFSLISAPVGAWSDGNMDIHDVMDHIFTTEAERAHAVLRLHNAGFGQGETNFLYFKKDQITVNGYVFDKIKDAKLFIEKSKLKKIRAFILGKNEFPKELKTDGVYFYMIPWDKRQLPEVPL